MKATLEGGCHTLDNNMQKWRKLWEAFANNGQTGDNQNDQQMQLYKTNIVSKC